MIIIGIFLLVVIIFALIFFKIIPGLKTYEKKNINPIAATLKIWLLYEKPEYFQEIVATFNETYPKVKIEFKSYDDQRIYEKEILNALAENRGPDIFMIPNGGLLNYLYKISPIPYQKYSLRDLKNQFPQVVESDFYYQGNIFALPLAIDTLVLIYNRDLLNQAGIIYPPTTWEEFQSLIPKVVKKDEFQNISIGVALGGSGKSIERAVDILSNLMIQKGAFDEINRPNFDSEAALEALNFYLQFSNFGAPYYSWNDQLGKDFDLFLQEKVAMIFGYYSDWVNLKKKASKLNLSISSFPQFEKAFKKTLKAHYWGYTVSNQSRYKNLAWDFILHFTTNPSIAKLYFQRNLRPPALHQLILQIQDPELSLFNNQTLISKSWQIKDSLAFNKIISESIEMVLNNRLKPKEALIRMKQEFINL